MEVILDKDKTPIKIEFQPSMALKEAFTVTFNTTKTRNISIPRQVLVSLNNFQLVWEGEDSDEAILEKVEVFNEDSPEPLSYRLSKSDLIELSPTFIDLFSGETSFRFENQNGDAKSLSSPIGEYYMQIKSPSSIGKKGIKQFLPQKATYLIPSDGKVKLALAPTANKFPLGRYEIEYFHNSDPLRPIDRQYWLVPERPNAKTINLITPMPPETPLEMPKDFYSVLSLSSNVISTTTLDWTVDWNQFQFILDKAPEPDDPFALTYQSALTLDQILDLSMEAGRYGQPWY